MIKAAMFDAREYDEESFGRCVKGRIEITYFEVKLEERTVSLARGFDAVIVFVNDSLSKKVIEKLHEYKVKVIALRCAGYNNVDVKTAYGKIHILRVPAYSPEAVAEHTAALLLTSVRRIHKAYNRTRDFNFSIAGLEGFNLCGKTAGVIGCGKIGQAFVKILNGLGMKVLAYDRSPKDGVDAEFVSLDEIYARCDVISLHCPLSEENEHMINAETIGKMKKGVIILNTSRGALIDAEALLEAVKQKKVGAACLDVYEEESDLFFEDKSGHILDDDVLARLLSMPNVIVTSHQAFLTEEALTEIADTTIQNICDFFDGKPLKNEICYDCGEINDCKKQRKNRCF